MSSSSFRATPNELAHINKLVARYEENRDLIGVMLKQVGDALLASKQLMANVHSTKSRLKDPEHLRDKLLRKLAKQREKGKALGISESNLFRKINDLAGFRILHLHTEQFREIDIALRDVFTEYRYPLIEQPSARTWDDEYREFFKRIGIRTIESPKMYTSVHYIIESNNVSRHTCEIQVRTLAEELWGEVDHSMNYPHESQVKSCREQIKVLARMTSSCSRLVDSIFSSSKAFEENSRRKKKGGANRRPSKRTRRL